MNPAETKLIRKALLNVHLNCFKWTNNYWPKAALTVGDSVNKEVSNIQVQYSFG